MVGFPTPGQQQSLQRSNQAEAVGHEEAAQRKWVTETQTSDQAKTSQVPADEAQLGNR